MSKLRYVLTSNGEIIIKKKRNFLQRLIKDRWFYYKTITVYKPRKEYTNSEIEKLCKFNVYERDLDDKDYAVIVNSIRPNTFKESIKEVTDNKYYMNVTAKEDINLLRTSK